MTSKKYMLKLRLRLFDATVSPTLCYAAGTWTPSREHERMIQSTQRKLLKRKYKKIEKHVMEHKDEEGIADKTEMTMKAEMVEAQNLKMIWTVE